MPKCGDSLKKAAFYNKKRRSGKIAGSSFPLDQFMCAYPLVWIKLSGLFFFQNASVGTTFLLHLPVFCTLCADLCSLTSQRSLIDYSISCSQAGSQVCFVTPKHDIYHTPYRKRSACACTSFIASIVSCKLATSS